MVAGPFSGYASNEIVQLLGLGGQVGPNKMISPTTTWASFEQSLQSGPLHTTLEHQPAPVQKEIDALALLAGQETPSRLSTSSGGGTDAGIHAQTLKDFCAIGSSDPGTVPVIVTYFLHPALGGDPSTKQIEAYMPKFKGEIKAMTSAIANRPAVVLVEIDGLGSSAAMAKTGSLAAWEQALNYEDTQFEALPHTAVYVEGGYSDSNSVGYTVQALKAVKVNAIQGFFTNDTHLQWTSHEVAWASQIAKQLNTHFIVNTSDNGQGPLLNKHPTTEGVEDNCNPPSRGIGILPTTKTQVPRLDAYLWTHPPGVSGGSCNGRTYPGFAGGEHPATNGAFWPAKAASEVGLANARFGPPPHVNGNSSKGSVPYSPPTLEANPSVIPTLPGAPAPHAS